jgi:DNA-directed RNA polymerase subunit RPC12/RpoP
MAADLVYEDGPRLFRVVDTNGVWGSFNPKQLVAADVQQGRPPANAWELAFWVEWSNGDSYAFVFNAPTKQTAEDVKAKMDSVKSYSKKVDAAIRLLKTRERVSGSEIASLLDIDPSANPNAVRDFVEEAISAGEAEGVFDGKDFVSKYGLQRETVHYEIVTNFELNKSGALVISCPKCGATLPVKGKESNVKCQYCGSPITIPRKILDMI